MKRPAPEELDAMRKDGLSSPVRQHFTAADRAVSEWERGGRRTGLAGALDWIDQLRRVFGDAEPDRTPWQGDDFRL